MEKWEVRTGGDFGNDPNAHDVYVQGSTERVAKFPWSQKKRAALAAAAPDLLEALYQTRALLLRDFAISPDHHLIFQAGEAILKAGGCL